MSDKSKCPTRDASVRQETEHLAVIRSERTAFSLPRSCPPSPPWSETLVPQSDVVPPPNHVVQCILPGRESDFVTGNNDADGPFLLQWAHKKFGDDPLYKQRLINLKQHLINWGGNASGVNVANIDNTGTIHPDTYWWSYDLGNVKKDKFSEVWANTLDKLMLGFRQSPRPVKGRCAQCKHLAICGGNTRTRAFAQTGDAWAEDPGCYLTDLEIGVISANKSAANIEFVEI